MTTNHGCISESAIFPNADAAWIRLVDSVFGALSCAEYGILLNLTICGILAALLCAAFIVAAIIGARRDARRYRRKYRLR